MIIRKARPEDISALRDIESAAGRLFAEIGMREVADDEPLSEDSLRGYQSGGRAWVAVDDSDRPVGYLLADTLDGNAYIEQEIANRAISWPTLWTETPTSSRCRCDRRTCARVWVGP